MLRTCVCKNFREIEKIVNSLGKNIVLAFDFDGVLAKDGWNSPVMRLIRVCVKNPQKLTEKYEVLAKRFEDLRNEYPNDQLLITELIEKLKETRYTSVSADHKLKMIYHRLNNFMINRPILTDELAPEVLHRLNENGISFFSLSANYDACSFIRPDQFRILGLSSYFSKPFLEKGGSTPRSPYFLVIDCNTVLTSKVIPREFHGKNPVTPELFWKNPGKYYAYFDKNCVNFSKGTVFKQLILDKVIPQKPKHLVFVDDSQKNVEKVGNACLGLGIDFHGVLYQGRDRLS
jgi:hypothetical protein